MSRYPRARQLDLCVATIFLWAFAQHYCRPRPVPTAVAQFGRWVSAPSTIRLGVPAASRISGGDGINAIPNFQTGGEGAVTGQEVLFNVNFTDQLDLAADHYFFVPQVKLTSGDFLWLSSGTPVLPDLQSWIRNGPLDPDWLRVGTDIVEGTTAPKFNDAFSLDGTVPEATSTVGLLALAMFVVVRFTHRWRIAG